MKTILDPSRASLATSGSSSKAFLPISGIRIGSRSQSPGQFFTDLDFQVGPGIFQSLRVGINGDEFDAGKSRRDHPVDGVTPGSSDTHDFYFRSRAVIKIIFEEHLCPPFYPLQRNY
jgi:hypothetical protein